MQLQGISTKKNKSFFYILFLLVTLTMLWLVWPYIATVFLSILTTVVFRPIYQKILKQVKGNSYLATGLSILLIFMIVLIPSSGIVLLVIGQIAAIISDVATYFRGTDISVQHIVDLVNTIIQNLPFLGISYQINSDQVIDLINSLVQPASQIIIAQLANLFEIGKNSFELIAHLFIFVYILASLFPNYDNFISFIKKLSPLDNRVDDIYINRVVGMIDSMVRGIFIIALVQGLLSGIFYWIAGVPYVLFWMVLATFLSIIPVGSGFVTIPMGIVLILTGNIWQGIMLILANVFFISVIDNIMRPKLASKEAQLPESLILLSILGGLSTIGFFGIIYGPVILILFYTTVEMYIKYYKLETNDNNYSPLENPDIRQI